MKTGYKNNFDKSSTGLDIEVYAHYDNELSRIFFNENFERLNDRYWYYIDCGNIEMPELDIELITKDITILRKYFKDYINSGESNFTDAEIKDYILLDCVDKYNSKKSYMQLLESYGIEAKFKENLQEIEVRGYSQGDYAYVVYNPDKIKQAWGVAPIESELKESFEHLFFDSPISCHAIVNGEEFYYELDSYDFKRQEFIEYVKEESGVDISDFLPENLPYND